MADLLRIDIDDGKYTLIQEESGKTLLHRYGEPWLEDLHGAKVFLAMGYELEELRAENARLRDILCLADELLMRTMGAFPLIGNPLREPCKIIRRETGSDAHARKERARQALEGRSDA